MDDICTLSQSDGGPLRTPDVIKQRMTGKSWELDDLVLDI